MGRTAPSRKPRQVAAEIRRLIEHKGERLWRYQDFPRMPFGALAQALSRLTRQGKLRRLSKGVYYCGRKTAFGASVPNPTALRGLAGHKNTKRKIFPAGIAAANLLGFSTQAAGRAEVATSGFRLPRKLLGSETVVHTRRPDAWAGLSDQEAALLDFLRQSGRTSELTPEQTVHRLLSLLGHRRRFERLLKVADTEPPRVRAMLGAAGAALGKPAPALARLRASLNPLSRYDFGVLRALPDADRWQARTDRRR